MFRTCAMPVWVRPYRNGSCYLGLTSEKGGLPMVRWIHLSCAIATAVGCSGVSNDRDQTIGASSSPLIGGRPANDGEYPSTVALLFTSNYLRCTMSKVGPRHFLVASPCLYDPTSGQLIPDFAEGAPMHVSTARTLNGAPTHVINIQQVITYPDWLACKSSCDQGRTPALSVIVVDRDTFDIAQASVDLSPVEPGSAVVKTGFGSEDPDAAAVATMSGRLKI